MARINFLTVFALIAVQYCTAQITFSGFADADFNLIASDPRSRTLLTVQNDQKVEVSAWMSEHGLISGWDLRALSVQYDYVGDTLYVGLDCWGICGDADGDGNPGSSSDHGSYIDANAKTFGPVNGNIKDYPNQITDEYTDLMLWTNPPAGWTPGKNFRNYFPDVIVGDSIKGGLDKFDSYKYDWRAACGSSPKYSKSCNDTISAACNSPGGKINDSAPISKLYQDGRYGAREIQSVILHHSPNSSHPDLEFAMPTFSHYGEFSFRPGIDNIRFAFSLALGAGTDACGEEVQYPALLLIPCLIHDACGVCNGDNTTCQDCKGVPKGSAKYDLCGVCNGNGSSCWDCFHVPNGTATVDACGECGGDNSTCLDCKGVPKGLATYDACGVCDGNGTSCWDCFHVVNGTAEYDQCGICGGNGKSCVDCSGTINGTKTVDACGECGGSNLTCQDCHGVPNGPWKYEEDGTCACFYRDTLTFYPDDTWIELNDREANHEFEGYLHVSHNRSRALLEWFNIRQTVLQKHRHETPEHTAILSAKFFITLAECGGQWEVDDAELAFHRIGRFVSKEATWDCRDNGIDNDCCTQWRMMSLPPKIHADYTTTPSLRRNLTTGENGTLVFDVLDEITDYVYEEEDLYFAYLAKKVCEKGKGFCKFFSVESGESIRPKIVLDIKTYCPAPVTPEPEVPCPDKEDDWDWDKKASDAEEL